MMAKILRIPGRAEFEVPGINSIGTHGLGTLPSNIEQLLMRTGLGWPIVPESKVQKPVYWDNYFRKFKGKAPVARVTISSDTYRVGGSTVTVACRVDLTSRDDLEWPEGDDVEEDSDEPEAGPPSQQLVFDQLAPPGRSPFAPAQRLEVERYKSENLEDRSCTKPDQIQQRGKMDVLLNLGGCGSSIYVLCPC
ncbi:hypothetical protein F4777DRAFT_186388 [Nemania sp. FL0916]|nr:hypothetical protein F4777DRAFT_186388 [Nemania sp. FL0916]